MKAAQVIRRFSFDEWGGTENVVWNISRNLPHFGVESEILATSALGDDSAARGVTRPGRASHPTT